MGFSGFRFVWSPGQLSAAREGDTLPIARDLLGAQIPGGWGPERLRRLLHHIAPNVEVWKTAFCDLRPQGVNEAFMLKEILIALD